jgi:hypothetical protein
VILSWLPGAGWRHNELSLCSNFPHSGTGFQSRNWNNQIYSIIISRNAQVAHQHPYPSLCNTWVSGAPSLLAWISRILKVAFRSPRKHRPLLIPRNIWEEKPHSTTFRQYRTTQRSVTMHDIPLAFTALSIYFTACPEPGIWTSVLTLRNAPTELFIQSPFGGVYQWATIALLQIKVHC